MTKNTVPPKGQFLDPTGSCIPIPAEFECVLRVGDGEIIVGVPQRIQFATNLRPLLHVPRDDDFIDGFPPGKVPNANGGGDGKGGKVAMVVMVVLEPWFFRHRHLSVSFGL
jgi:hypothetical protein